MNSCEDISVALTLLYLFPALSRAARCVLTFFPNGIDMVRIHICRRVIPLAVCFAQFGAELFSVASDVHCRTCRNLYVYFDAGGWFRQFAGKGFATYIRSCREPFGACAPHTVMIRIV